MCFFNEKSHMFSKFLYGIHFVSSHFFVSLSPSGNSTKRMFVRQSHCFRDMSPIDRSIGDEHKKHLFNWIPPSGGSPPPHSSGAGRLAVGVRVLLGSWRLLISTSIRIRMAIMITTRLLESVSCYVLGDSGLHVSRVAAECCQAPENDFRGPV